MAGPTVGATETSSTVWAARPRLARVVRICIAVVPLLATFALTWWLAKVFPREESPLPTLVWFAVVILAANAVLITARRVTRRFVPIAALLQVSMIFPDQAPSRMRIALREHSSKKLLAQLGEFENAPAGTTPSADFLLGLLTELSDHDRLTRGHSERVRAYTDLIADELEIPDGEKQKLRWAALLHDVGKLHVPAEILNKDGRPTDEEWAILQNHPAAAVSMMAPLRGWLGDWALAAEQHHLRWDGKGYPLPLAGEEISLAGRIVAVADAFDTMTSARSYKRAMSAEAGRREIAKCAGSQFDPEVVRAFLAVGIGKLRAVLGPLGTLAGLAEQARIPLRLGTAGSVAGGAAAVAIATVIGLVTPDIDEPSGGAERVIAVAPADDSATGDSDTPVGSPPEPPTTTITPATTTTITPATTTTALDVTNAGPTAPISTTTSTAPRLPLVPAVPSDDVRAMFEDGTLALDVLANDNLGGVTVDRVVITAAPAKGSVWVDGSNLVRYTPAANVNGFDSLRYAILDTSGTVSTSATARFAIAAVNDAPSFTPGPAIGALASSPVHTSSWATSISAGPTDESGQIVSFVLTNDNPGVFTVPPSIGTDGILRFTHTGAVGSANVSVTATDNGGTANGGTAASTASTFQITVSSTNTAPTGVADLAGTLEDTLVNIDVTGNDTDPEDGTPTGAVTIVATPSSGTAVVLGNRSIDYTPMADSNGNDAFTYTVADSAGATSSTTTVVVAVTAVNDAPSFVAGSNVSANEDSGSVVHPTWVSGMSPGPADESGQTLSFVVANSAPALFATPPAVNAATGDLTYTLQPNAYGSATLQVELADNGGLANGGVDTSATVSRTLTVNALPDPPTAGADSYSGSQDTQLVVVATGVLGNDTDPDGDTLSVNTTPTVAPTNGTLLLAADGSFTYDPDPGWAGTDSFTYQVDDGTGRSDTAIVTITIAPAFGSSMVISQFAAAGSHSSGDFVELYNSTGAAIDIGGWQLRITNDASIVQTVSIPIAGAVIPAGGFYLVGAAGSPYAWDTSFPGTLPLGVGLGLHDGTAYVDQVGTQARPEPRPTVVPASLWAEGTGVTPFDLTATTIDQTNRRRVDYGAGHCTDTDNNAADFIRRFASAPRSTGSPVEPCGTVTPPSAVSHLVISEIRTDGPLAGDNEFTEVFNPTGAAINLGGFELRDTDGHIEYVFAAINLAPGQHFLIGGASYSGAVDGTMAVDGIKNGGGAYLWDTAGAGSMIDEIQLGPAAPNLPVLGGRLLHSYQRLFGGCADTDVWLDDFQLAFSGNPETSSDLATPC